MLPFHSPSVSVEQRLGGFVQPLAFGGAFAPINGSGSDGSGSDRSGSDGAWVSMTAPPRHERISLGDAIGWASCAPGILWANAALVNLSQVVSSK